MRGDHNLVAMGNDVYTFKVKERMTFRLVLLSIYGEVKPFKLLIFVKKLFVYKQTLKTMFVNIKS